MKAIEAYETDDGKIFSTITEAKIHEETQEYMPEVTSFIDSEFCKYNNVSHRKILEKTLIAWIFWKKDKESK